jgi:hypothetical protein
MLTIETFELKTCRILRGALRAASSRSITISTIMKLKEGNVIDWNLQVINS